MAEAVCDVFISLFMESEISAYVIVRVILSDSPFLSTKVSLSVFVLNGNGLDVSKLQYYFQPIL